MVSVASAQTPVVPPAPSNLRVELGGFKVFAEIGVDPNDPNAFLDGGKILHVSWNEVTTGSPTGYRVQWRESGVSNWSAASHHDVNGASTTSYQIGTPSDGLTNGTSYDIRVFTRYGTNGLSAASTVITATPLTANQQFHFLIENTVRQAESEIPWIRKAWGYVPLENNSTFRKVLVYPVATSSRGAGYVAQQLTSSGSFRWVYPLELGVLHSELATELIRLYTIGHELHHAYLSGPYPDHRIVHHPHSITLPAGYGVSAADAFGYLYLAEVIRNRNFGNCAPVNELYADRAAETLIKAMMPSSSFEGIYWSSQICNKPPTSQDRTIFESIAAGNIPEYLYTRFRGSDGLWQRSEINNFWAWVLDNTFGTNGGQGVFAWIAMQGFNDSSFLGREYYDSNNVKDRLLAIEGVRDNTQLSQSEKQSQITQKTSEFLAEVPNPWQFMFPPLAPRNMTTDVSVANQLTVSWAAPENQGHDDVSEYVVELRSSAGAMCVVQRRSVVTDLSALSVRFAGLPAGDYDISVIARNSVPSDSTSAASATGVTVSGRSGQLCVAVSASSGAVAENGGTKTVTVKLGRALTAGETVEVPLTIAGVGTDVFMLALDPVSQSGVVLSTDGSDSLVQPRLTFTTGAQTATLRYTSVANAGRGSPLVSVGFGTGARAPSATGIAGALLRGGTARFLVTDDETGAVPVPHDWALIPSGLGVGDQFRLLFKTSTARDATSTDIAAYDRFVQDALIERGHEALRPFIGDFKVLGSTQSAAARQRLGLGSSGPAVYWLNGARIAASHTVFCQEQRDGGWNEDDFHTGNIKIETGGSRSSIAAPFTGINNECRTRTDMGGLYLGSTGQVVAGAGGVLTSGDDAWSAGPLGESLVDPAGERPFYGLSPVFEVTPTLSLTVGGSASVTEGTDATFTVTADHAPSAAITVNYTVSQEGDFVSAGTRTLNFSGTTTTISVTTLDDKLIEPDGSVTVTLNTGQSYVVGSSDTATVTVTDDDTPAESATFTPSSVSVSENSGTASYTVVLDSRPTADVTVA
ncbi:MAG: fibronectin type III domain-containing protein, partial [Acidimicrobiaceae bacterium]|nr:fibronectin type III domain-containing protein [Acidimicrobiaceae bacterium]